MEKKEAAHLLYMDGATNADISRVLKVSENTVSTWVVDGEWKMRRARRSLSQQTMREMMEDLALYQIEALNALAKRYRKEAEEEGGELRLLEKGEFDALSKAFSNIKSDELKWEEVVRITRQFIAYLETHDLDLAKQVLDHANAFINESRKKF